MFYFGNVLSCILVIFAFCMSTLVIEFHNLYPKNILLQKVIVNILFCDSEGYQVKSRAQKADGQKADINNPIKQKAEMQKTDMSKS
jgi:hypothetical protein